MFEIDFQKAKAQDWLESLKARRPIEGVTSNSDLLSLAGVCFHLAMAADTWTADVAVKPGEHREALEDTSREKSEKAMLFFAYLASRIDIGDYDEAWGKVVRAIVKYDETTGKMMVDPISGYRG